MFAYRSPAFGQRSDVIDFLEENLSPLGDMHWRKFEELTVEYFEIPMPGISLEARQRLRQCATHRGFAAVKAGTLKKSTTLPFKSTTKHKSAKAEY